MTTTRFTPHLSPRAQSSISDIERIRAGLTSVQNLCTILLEDMRPMIGLILQHEELTRYDTTPAPAVVTETAAVPAFVPRKPDTKTHRMCRNPQCTRKDRFRFTSESNIYCRPKCQKQAENKRSALRAPKTSRKRGPKKALYKDIIAMLETGPSEPNVLAEVLAVTPASIRSAKSQMEKLGYRIRSVPIPGDNTRVRYEIY